MDSSETMLLNLVGRALFGAIVKIPSNIDWYGLHNEAISQTVLPLIISSITDEEFLSVPSDLKVEWKTRLLQCHHSNERINVIQQKILHLFDEHKVPCVVLKGSTVAMNYPNPSLRVMGDIDFLVEPEHQLIAVDLLKEVGYEVEGGEHSFHISLSKDGVSVEIHKYPNAFTKIKDASISKYAQSLFQNAIDKRVYINSIPMLQDIRQAIVLIMHNLSHFYTLELGLRQLCDWAMFVEQRLTDELWKELQPILKNLGLLQFVGVMTKVCITYLHLPKSSASWATSYDNKLADKVISQIMKSGNFGKKTDKNELGYITNLYKASIVSYFKLLINSCKKYWRPCKKYPIFLAVAPPFAYINYLRRKRGKQQFHFKTVKTEQALVIKKKLAQSLRLFIPE